MARSSLRLQAKRRESSKIEQTQLEASLQKESDVDEDLQPSASGSKRARQETSDEEDDAHDKKRIRNTSGPKRVAQTKAKKSPTKRSGKVVPADKRFKNIRGKLGFLNRLVTDVPMEVIIQIFCYLQPLDILRLSRTSKALRSILMTRSSEFIWKAALANYEGLPPLPTDINVPQYINLMFDPHCHICLSKSCDDIIWEFRMRCCKKCRPTDLSTYTFADAAIYCKENGLSAVPTRVLSEILTRSPGYAGRPYHNTRLKPSQINQYISEYYNAIMTGNKNAWWIQRRNEMAAFEAHIGLCRQWHKQQLKDRELALENARKERREDVLAKLDEIGWADEARLIMARPAPGDNFSTHKMVYQATKLTDRRWALIKPPLVNFLQNEKAERLRIEKKKVLHARYTLLKSVYDKFCETRLHQPLPSIGDIFASELFDQIIWCTPVDQELKKDDFSEILADTLPAMIDGWREAKEKELMDAFREEVPDATFADLHLATSLFDCADTECPEYFWYPRMFYHHRKHSGPAALANYRPKHVDLELFDPFAEFKSYPWTPQQFKYARKRAETVKMIVEFCGLDPATATFDDLTAAEPLIECGFEGCQRSFKRQFFWWMRAPVHADHFQELSINSFGAYTEQILGAADNKDVEFIYHSSEVRCQLCNSRQRMSALREHLLKKHGIEGEITKDRWYWDPETPLAHLAPTLRLTGTGRHPPQYSSWTPTPLKRVSRVSDSHSTDFW